MDQIVCPALVEFLRFWCHIGFLTHSTRSRTHFTRTSSLTPLLPAPTLKHWFKGEWFTPVGILAINVQKEKRKKKRNRGKTLIEDRHEEEQ